MLLMYSSPETVAHSLDMCAEVSKPSSRNCIKLGRHVSIVVVLLIFIYVCVRACMFAFVCVCMLYNTYSIVPFSHSQSESHLGGVLE